MTEDVEINSNCIKPDHFTWSVDIRFPLDSHDSEGGPTCSLTAAEAELTEWCELAHEENPCLNCLLVSLLTPKVDISDQV